MRGKVLSRQISVQAVKDRSWAMPFDSPAFPKGRVAFPNRESLILTYRTDSFAARAAVPTPLQVPDDPLVQIAFHNTPDSTGFGRYTAVAQTINVLYQGQPGKFISAFFVDDDASIAAGREVWGFPSKLADAKLKVERDCLVGVLDIGSVNVATATCGYKHAVGDLQLAKQQLSVPIFTLKVIPHVDCSPRILQLVTFGYENVVIKGAWQGPGALNVHQHAMANITALPVRDVVSAHHVLSDSILGLGRVVKDYLQ